MGFMSLAVGSGSVVKLIAEGSDEKEAIRCISKLY